MDSSLVFDETPQKSAAYVAQKLSTAVTTRIRSSKAPTEETRARHGSTIFTTNPLVSPPPRKRTTSLMSRKASLSSLRPATNLPMVGPADDDVEELEDGATVKPISRTISANGRLPNKPKQSALPEQVMLVSSPTQDLTAALREKDAEIYSLKAKLAAVEHEKKQLSRQSRIVTEPDMPAGFDTLSEQFAAQERLLAGYQRENERALAEISAMRNRERQIQAHLGPSWQDIVGLSPSALPQRQHATPEAKAPLPVDAPHAPSTSPSTNLASIDAIKLLAQVSSAQLLVESMEKRLAESDALLESKEAAARTSRTKLQAA